MLGAGSDKDERVHCNQKEKIANVVGRWGWGNSHPSVTEKPKNKMDTNTYYYEEQTRNGKQWFRITPNGDWMPKREAVEQKYDRAGMATAAMQGLCANHGSYGSGNGPGDIAERAVFIADSLIAELQRTEK